MSGGIGQGAFFLLVDQPFTLLQPLFWLFIGVLGLVIFVTDVKYLIIPDWAVALMAIATVVYRLVLLQAGILQPGDFKAMILAALLVGASFWLLRWATKNWGWALVTSSWRPS